MNWRGAGARALKQAPYEPPKSDSPLPAREIARGLPAAYVAGTALMLLVANLAAYELRIGDELITTLWMPAGVLLASLMFAPLRL